MTSSFIPGQRWLSNAEPELGLGTVLRVAGRSVQIVFTGSDMLRHYAMASAPLLRAAFRPGDRVRAHGVDHEIEQVEERNGLLYYLAGDKVLAEGELDADQPVSQADSRLLAGRFDRSAQFEFRLEALQRRAAALRHPGWGVLGARIDLIPHQLRVAEVGMQRRSPRLLLADDIATNPGSSPATRDRAVDAPSPRSSVPRSTVPRSSASCRPSPSATIA